MFWLSSLSFWSFKNFLSSFFEVGFSFSFILISFISFSNGKFNDSFSFCSTELCLFELFDEEEESDFSSPLLSLDESDDLFFFSIFSFDECESEFEFESFFLLFNCLFIIEFSVSTFSWKLLGSLNVFLLGLSFSS